jgi:uncharacterized membrane protein YkoI
MKLAGMKWMVVIAAVSLLGGMSYGEKDNESPRLSAALKAVVKAMFPTASVEGVERGVKGIKVVEIELKDGEKDCSIDLAEDGTVISVETQVEMKGLPKAVARAIKEEAGDEEITVVEREEIRAVVKLVVLEKPETVYETKFVKDGEEYELKVAASGAVLAMKLANDEEEEEDESVEEDDDDGDDDMNADEDGDDDGDDEGDEEESEAVTIDEVPQAVKDTLLKEADGGTVEEIEKETEDGAVVYDADVVVNDEKFELKIDENGKLLSKEADEDEDQDADEEGDDDGDDDGDEEESEAVTIDEVPQAVKDTLLKEADGGTVEEIEKETEDGKTVYGADIVKDDKKFELKVDENGQLLSKEADEDNDKDADQDEDGDDDKDGDKGSDQDDDHDGK